jgi:putative sterol carrier protein
MADESDKTLGFFSDFLPKKVAGKPELQGSIKNSIVFDIVEEDGKTPWKQWTLDLKTPESAGVKEGAGDAPGCTLTVSKSNWEKILANPGAAMGLFMTGKLKVKGSQGLAMQLQKILA